jgi:two-component system, chemotaxis family, protein-glutamate methylesterase/glutaminase
MNREALMIHFCEECGKRMENVNGDNTLESILRCPTCHESRKEGYGVVPGMGWFGNEASADPSALVNPLKVLVVDDSSILRKAIRGILETDRNIRVIAEAANGAEAVELVPRVEPDVITLDINMPVMDGITALKHIMIKSPKPTIMFSTLTKEGAWISLDALRYGAVDFLNKPSQHDATRLDVQQRVIIEKVKMAAKVRTDTLRLIRTENTQTKKMPVSMPKIQSICAIGAAEGGFSALLKLIPQLGTDLPAAFVAVLYAPRAHVKLFAEYLDKNSRQTVRLAQDGDPIRSGFCYLVPGSDYPAIESYNDECWIRTSASPFPDRRGTLNMLMLSLSEASNIAPIGIVLTGDGEDGADGAMELIRSGGQVLVQDPDTCLVKTMSWVTIKRCPEARVVPINRMAEEIKYLTHPRSNRHEKGLV